jgi:hypothetical protein
MEPPTTEQVHIANTFIVHCIESKVLVLKEDIPSHLHDESLGQIFCFVDFCYQFSWRSTNHGVE